ncbi:glycosyltransferase family 2 protein, partial [Acinetobacter stercoris]|uniref:glycosyltransferase family 2 protein n=1 Tax=Acinetobacter stercoris TaxID=2126983 RepID=UPI000EFC973B
MLFSIIVPVYNVELYLRDCLDSIFCQDFYSCEIICVNDGSTDNSRHILEEYKDRITIVDQSNLGLSAARNTGLKHSKGDYVWFVDSDDMIAKDSFVKLEKIIADTRAEIIFFSAENFIDTNIVKKWGEYNRKFTGIYKAIDYFELQCDSNNYFVSACMYIF